MKTPIVMFSLAVLAAWTVTTTKTEAHNSCEDPDNYFDCGDGHCIRKEYVCDTRKQCHNDADEFQSCPTPRACYHENQFRCTDGSCIPEIQVCDGQANCEDGSDENFKKCRFEDCNGKNQFRCSSVTKPEEPMYCLALDSVCDGVQDCPEGEDETSDLCPSLTYSKSHNNCEDPNNYFDCGDGHCIKVQYVCDTRPQCSSGVDEYVYCPTPRACRHENQFRCTDGSCIPGIKECDGRADCVDGSDEYNGCRFEECEGTNQFRCSSVTEPEEPMYCLALDSVCDGVQDCPEGEDETSDLCPSRTYNEPQGNQLCQNSAKFNCGNGQCLAPQKVCDRSKHCRNYADEANCG